MLLDLKVDGAGWRVRKEILEFLRVHFEMSLDAAKFVDRRG